MALRSMAVWVAAGVGPEGAFLAVGTGCLAVFAAALNPVGPWLVVGAMSVAVGIALARPH